VLRRYIASWVFALGLAAVSAKAQVPSGCAIRNADNSITAYFDTRQFCGAAPTGQSGHRDQREREFRRNDK